MKLPRLCGMGEVRGVEMGEGMLVYRCRSFSSFGGLGALLFV